MGRVVAVASTAHKMGKLDVEDLNWERRKYAAWGRCGAFFRLELLEFPVGKPSSSRQAKLYVEDLNWERRKYSSWAGANGIFVVLRVS